MRHISFFDSGDGVFVSTIAVVFIAEIVFVLCVFVYEYFKMRSKEQYLSQESKDGKFKIELTYGVGQYILIMLIIANCIFFFQAASFVKDTQEAIHEAKAIKSDHEKMLKQLSSAKVQLDYVKEGNDDMQERLFKTLKENKNLKSELAQKTYILDEIFSKSELMRSEIVSLKEKLEKGQELNKPVKNVEVEVKKEKPRLIIKSYEMR